MNKNDKLRLQGRSLALGLGRSQDKPNELWEPAPTLDTVRRQILDYAGTPALSARDVARRAGLGGRQAVSKRRRAGTLLGLPYNQKEFRYPSWQFDPENPGQLFFGLQDLLAFTPIDDMWGLADLLTSPQPALGDRTPIDALADRETRNDSLAIVVALAGERFSVSPQVVNESRAYSARTLQDPALDAEIKVTFVRLAASLEAWHIRRSKGLSVKLAMLGVKQAETYVMLLARGKRAIRPYQLRSAGGKCMHRGRVPVRMSPYGKHVAALEESIPVSQRRAQDHSSKRSEVHKPAFHD